jgi:muconolactone delta-isomerase
MRADIVPSGTSPDYELTDQTKSARELAGQGRRLRLWRLPPGNPGALDLWQAREAAEMQAIVELLPLYPWMMVQTTLLTEHPSDPAQSIACPAGWPSSPGAPGHRRRSVTGYRGGAGRWWPAR